MCGKLDFRKECLQCPICKQGVIDYKSIDSQNETQLFETYYYSCGHDSKICEFTEEIKINPILNNIYAKSLEKIGKKRVFELEQKYQTNDMDNPDRNVWQIFFTKRNSSTVTIQFQIVTYESGTIKHIHCKFCNTEWKYRDNFGHEDLFILNLGKKTYIECLYCHAKFER